MRTYRLDLEYDGTDFHGWQVQPGQRTVQGELAAALEQLFQMPVRVAGAGRTDAGVHALGQVASFTAEADIEPRRILQALPSLLPADMYVWRAGQVSDGFSARGTALSRRYVYRMLRRTSPLGRRFNLLLREAVDAARMADAVPALLGSHDFSAFAANRSAAPERTCVVESAAIDADPAAVRFDITANRFLHNMVRRIAGCLVEIGRGRLVPADLGQILASGDFNRGGPCLPAHGLTLVEVRYPADPLFDASAVVDGPRWTP